MCFNREEKSEEAIQQSKKIDQQIRKEKREIEKNEDIKLLLLGSGESGKSTVLKQFKLVYGSEWSLDERKRFRVAVLNNLFGSAASLIGAMKTLNLEWGSEKAKIASEKLLLDTKRVSEETTITPDLIDALKMVWNDSGIKTCYSRSNEFQLIDTCKYFMDNIDRICGTEFVPSNQDILQTRLMTTSISESRFNVEKNVFRVFDVGGQRSERKKWAPYFDDCTAIIFVAALSAYDQTCFEDNTTNRMVESINLFESICNHKLFTKTAIILFLNKIDLFKEKLPKIPVNKYFPNYEGENEYTQASNFFAKRFVSRNNNPEKRVYINFTWATDTNQIKAVLTAVNAIILRLSLESSGI